MTKLNLFSDRLRLFGPDNPNGGSTTEPATEPTTDPVTTEPATEPGGEPTTKPATEPAKKYTDDEVNEIVNKKYAKWKAEEKARADEAAKFSKMDDDQKQKFALEQAKQEAAEAKASVAKYKMTSMARKSANEAGIAVTDDDLAHIVTTEAESTKANIDWLKDLSGRIHESVKKEYLSGSAPKANGGKLKASKGDYGAYLAENVAAKSEKKSYFKN